MTMTDPIADMLTRIRNGIQVRRDHVDVPASKLKSGVALVLKEEGYVEDVEVIEARPQSTLRIHLKYDRNGVPAIQEIRRVSKPGCRIYTHARGLTQVRGGLGRTIVTTSKGVMSGAKAAAEGIGGEVLCTVF